MHRFSYIHIFNIKTIKLICINCPGTPDPCMMRLEGEWDPTHTFDQSVHSTELLCLDWCLITYAGTCTGYVYDFISLHCYVKNAPVHEILANKTMNINAVLVIPNGNCYTTTTEVSTTEDPATTEVSTTETTSAADPCLQMFQESYINLPLPESVTVNSESECIAACYNHPIAACTAFQYHSGTVCEMHHAPEAFLVARKGPHVGYLLGILNSTCVTRGW